MIDSSNSGPTVTARILQFLLSENYPLVPPDKNIFGKLAFMIDPKELRLNNAVIMPDDRVGTVKEIGEKKVRVMEEHTLYPLTPGELRPIIITHEILERCGFRLDLEPSLVNQDGSIRPPEGFIWKGNVKLYLRGDEIYSGSHYINEFHKLQNLYFFSTQIELPYTR